MGFITVVKELLFFFFFNIHISGKTTLFLEIRFFTLEVEKLDFHPVRTVNYGSKTTDLTCLTYYGCRSDLAWFF